MLTDSYRPGLDFRGDPEQDKAHRQRNFELCNALNIGRLGMVLEDMVASGMPKEQAEVYRTSAIALLALMRSENNRLYTSAPQLG